MVEGAQRRPGERLADSPPALLRPRRPAWLASLDGIDHREARGAKPPIAWATTLLPH